MSAVWLRNVGDEDECWVPCAKGDVGAVCFVPAQGQPNLKQIEAAIDEYLGNIDATYEDSRRRCAQNILDLYAVPSTTCACLKPGGDPLGTCEQCSPSAQRCAKCGCETKSEEALVNGEIWCHPCADTVALSSPQNQTAKD